MKKLIILLASTVFIFSGCTKSDSKSVSQVTLTAHTWMPTAKYVNGADQNIGDCVKDDTYKFQTGGAFVFDEGPTKCNATDPQSGTANWTLSGNSCTLSSGGQSSVYTITSLDDSKLDMNANVNGQNERLVFRAQ